jgi:hypothetical protein
MEEDVPQFFGQIDWVWLYECWLNDNNKNYDYAP